MCGVSSNRILVSSSGRKQRAVTIAYIVLGDSHIPSNNNSGGMGVPMPDDGIFVT